MNVELEIKVEEKNTRNPMCIFVDMANVDEPIYLACRRALVGCFLLSPSAAAPWHCTALVLSLASGFGWFKRNQRSPLERARY